MPVEPTTPVATTAPGASALPVEAPPPSAAPDVATAAPAVSSTAGAGPSKPGAVPNWTTYGSDVASGSMVLRCENAFPPDDRSGHCRCEGYELNVCVDGIRQLTIDRKQCSFVCKPKPQDAKQVALRCPDGSNPTASPQGCSCSGRKPLDPCAGGLASTKLTAGECVVTCRQAQ